jgi:arylformamidase
MMLPVPKRVVDLSHTIIPGREEYRLEMNTRLSDEWPAFAKYKRVKNEWYILSEVTMSTHVGTHIEFPYHHFEDGADASQFPLDRLIGEAVVIDISAWRNNACIDLGDLQSKAANLLMPGDAAYFYTGLDSKYRSAQQHDRPWFAPEAIQWLASEVRIKIMGVDTTGIEMRNQDGSPTEGQPNHKSLLGQGIPLIESLTHLEEFLGQRFYTYVLPVKLAGAEAFPVRVIGVQ